MTIQIESDNLKEGLLGLVMALVEILKDVLEKQAIHRLESGSLSEEEAEKLGLALMNLDATIDRIKRENGIERTSNKIRAELDRIVNDSLNVLINPIENENVR